MNTIIQTREDSSNQSSQFVPKSRINPGLHRSHTHTHRRTLNADALEQVNEQTATEWPMRKRSAPQELATKTCAVALRVRSVRLAADAHQRKPLEKGTQQTHMLRYRNGYAIRYGLLKTIEDVFVKKYPKILH